MIKFLSSSLLAFLFALATSENTCGENKQAKYETECLSKGYPTGIDGCEFSYWYDGGSLRRDRDAMKKCLKIERALEKCGFSCEDGGWSNYGDWSDCSASWNGTQTRTRSCTNPIPSYNKADCEGEDTENQACNFGVCSTESVCYAGDTSFIALELGSSLTSPNGNYTFRMQQEGDLVLDCNGNSIWSSGTNGSVKGLAFQDDSNLVIYSTEGTALWSSRTANTEGTMLQVQDDGNVVLYTDNLTMVWETDTVGRCDPIDGGWSDFGDWSDCSVSCGDGTQTRTRSCINPAPADNGANCEGEEIESQACNIAERCCIESVCYAGDTSFIALELGSSLTSPNGNYTFRMQQEGDLVLDCNGNSIWSSGTNGSVKGLAFQGDSNLVIYSTEGTALWSSRTVNTEGTMLQIQDDGNVVLYTDNLTMVWETDTVGRCDPIDGGWSDFGDWSDCSVSCGNGTQTRTRSCINPAPADNGADCEGEDTESQACNIAERCCIESVCYAGDTSFIALELGSSLTSPNGNYTFRMQQEGDLVLDCNGNSIWSSGTNGSVKGLAFQGDSNLVIYSTEGTALWSSRTPNTEGAMLQVQDDGNVVLYTDNLTVVWETETDGLC